MFKYIYPNNYTRLIKYDMKLPYLLENLTEIFFGKLHFDRKDKEFFVKNNLKHFLGFKHIAITEKVKRLNLKFGGRII